MFIVMVLDFCRGSDVLWCLYCLKVQYLCCMASASGVRPVLFAG